MIRIIKSMTYGEFLDHMKGAAKGIEYGVDFIEIWEEEVTLVKLEEYRPLSLEEGLVSNFVDNAIGWFRHLIEGTEVDELRAKRLEEGHALLRAIRVKCTEIGIELPLDQIEVPLYSCDFTYSSSPNLAKASEIVAIGHLEVRPEGIFVVSGQIE